MRHKITLALLLAALPCCLFAQSKPQPKTDRDQFGMTCAQILLMSSSDWIAKVASADPSAAGAQIRGIVSYGRCYDARTDRLAASLAKTGKGPLMGAQSDFRDFEASINDFTAKVFAPTPDPLKAAYAALYEKQFRYDFFQSYESKNASAPGTVKKSVPAPAAAETPPPAPKPSAPAASNVQPGEEPKDVDEMTLAKNRFGELLRPMEDDRLHEIHAAFGEILGMHHADPAMQLAVYRYAIFVLETPSAKPFSPPPF